MRRLGGFQDRRIVRKSRSCDPLGRDQGTGCQAIGGDGDDVVSDLPSLLEYFCTRLKVLVVVQKLLLSNVLPI